MDAVLQLPAPVNISVTNSFDGGTRELTVTADLYYTANSPTGNDRMHVLIAGSHYRLADRLRGWWQPTELRSSPCAARVPHPARG
ncbi:MAG: hypothetical protein IPI07_02910 [Flavobacteriales bacterium]|nr:hypothetical protein [Flavobacteriales bacterium]